MKEKSSTGFIINFLFLFVIVTSSIPDLTAQNDTNSSPGRNLYRPPDERVNDTLKQEEKTNTLVQVNQDSIDTRMQFVRDSIESRMQFIRDSIAAREAFIRDSIARRERKIDSLNFLLAALPDLLEASVKTASDEIIIGTIKPQITEELTLTNYVYITLPFDFTRPYTPWKSALNLSNKPISIVVDAEKKKITSIQSSSFHYTYDYNSRSRTLRIDEPGTIISRPTGKFYKVPVDTVFYDAGGRISKIKKYYEYYQVKNSYQKGSFLFTQLVQVLQYGYNTGGVLTEYQLINFCERSNAQEPKKVCNMITYQVSRQGNIYYVTRKNEPANPYSDGEFTYEFQGNSILKSVAFTNSKKTENWKTYIEVNPEGYVSNYIYENQGAIKNSLLINYYLNDPNAKHKVETISCSFEDDGVSYYQKNNMTGKSRIRDKLTMEWSTWR